jgi:hypothetical protein
MSDTKTYAAEIVDLGEKIINLSLAQARALSETSLLKKPREKAFPLFGMERRLP